MALKAALALLLLAAGIAAAGAPERAPAPPPRPDLTAGEAIVLRAGVPGDVAYVVVDAETGETLEEMAADLPLPPASVAKAPTALYALERLRADYRFETRVIVNGEIVDGRLDGDLILQGGGDPELDTVDLDRLALAVFEAGVSRVDGRFIVDPGPFPLIERIDPSQPEHVGYNPSVSSLNLNFNRARLEWRTAGGGPVVAVEARADGLSPPTPAVLVEPVEATGDGRVFEYVPGGAAELWRVNRRAMGAEGGRWLPVRRPARYAGVTFRDLAAARGVAIPPPEAGTGPLLSPIIARHESRPLADILLSMLDHSTNLTAEVAGLAATRATGAEPETLMESAAAMNRWIREFSGATGVELVNHSGLNGGSRATARALAALFAAAERRGYPGLSGGRAITFPSLLKRASYKIRSAPDPEPKAVVRAKSGTMDFVSGLAGYIHFENGRRLVFAILSADLERREDARALRVEQPPGARRYSRNARYLQTLLLREWITRYGGG